jgi:hypothetical protein
MNYEVNIEVKINYKSYKIKFYLFGSENDKPFEVRNDKVSSIKHYEIKPFGDKVARDKKEVEVNKF